MQWLLLEGRKKIWIVLKEIKKICNSVIYYIWLYSNQMKMLGTYICREVRMYLQLVLPGTIGRSEKVLAGWETTWECKDLQDSWKTMTNHKNSMRNLLYTWFIRNCKFGQVAIVGLFNSMLFLKSTFKSIKNVLELDLSGIAFSLS